MAHCVRIPNGIMTLVEVDFKCPKCAHPHHEEDYYKRLRDSKKCFIYMSCKGCKSKLGVSYDMMGDVVVWLKDEEKKEGEIKWK